MTESNLFGEDPPEVVEQRILNWRAYYCEMAPGQKVAREARELMAGELDRLQKLKDKTDHSAIPNGFEDQIGRFRRIIEDLDWLIFAYETAECFMDGRPIEPKMLEEE